MTYSIYPLSPHPPHCFIAASIEDAGALYLFHYVGWLSACLAVGI